MSKSLKPMLFLAIVSTLIFGGWATARIIKAVEFNLNCEAYIKRSANANTIELAKKELATSIDYIEKNNLTRGVVSIFLKNPTNDIEFWYQNLKAAYEELDNLNEDATALEKTNVLMKLRESLTDRESGGGTKVIVPSGITIYPDNSLYFWWCTLSTILMTAFWTIFTIQAEKKYHFMEKLNKVNK